MVVGEDGRNERENNSDRELHDDNLSIYLSAI